jgi:hypothetical protein
MVEIHYQNIWKHCGLRKEIISRNQEVPTNRHQPIIYIDHPQGRHTHAQMYEKEWLPTQYTVIHEMICNTMAMKKYIVDPCHIIDHSHKKIQCGSMS